MEWLKNRSRYRNYISLQALVVLGVLGVFKVIPVREASLLASSFFLLSTLLILLIEKKRHSTSSVSFVAASIFLVFSILPVLVFRVLSWQTDFSSYELFGVTGAQLHQISRYFFLSVIVGHFVDVYKSKRPIS
jgi:hypothetical protein